MARYIDADNLVSVLDILCDKDGDIRYWEQLKWIVADCPTADVVEVVRCKDCKYYLEAERMCNDTNGFDRWWKPDDFCSHGERRTDDDRNG